MTGSASRLTGFFVPVQKASTIRNSANYTSRSCKKFGGIAAYSSSILVTFYSISLKISN